MENQTASTKAGYAKLLDSAKEALNNGFDYIWIDTCCIDKTSSAELSEAINAMFRWYKEAVVCYAFLADVPSDTTFDAGSPFANSKWFTRGWTLQELLAPDHLEFYSTDWSRHGSKSQLGEVISSITGIDGEYLKGRPLFEASIAALALVITIVAAVLSYLQLSRQAPPIEPKPRRERKSIVVRIQEIPIEKSKEGLQNDLMSLASKDPELETTVKGVERLTFARVNKHDARATAIFPTTLPQSELLRRLKEASYESSMSYEFDCDFYGITPLTDADGDNAVDIIAVPGLASHPIGTWRSSKPGNNNVWLRDFLPRDIPDARILLYGYDTKLLRSNSRQNIEELSEGLLDLISAVRRDQESKRRPIIFIGHSLGGLLVKECLLRAMKQKDFEPYHAIFQACCGLLLFGVPSHGLNNRALLSIVEDQPNVSLIRDLILDDHLEPSAFLKRISTDFSERWGSHCPVVCFYETRLTSTVQMSSDGTLKKAGPGVSMVTSHSATSAVGEAGEPAVSFDVDHSGLVKFDSRSHDLYDRVLNRLVRVVDSAKDRLSQRHLDTLSPDDQRQWNNLNDPPYSAFRNSAKLPKPEEGTLEWLVREENDTIDHDKDTNADNVPNNQREKVLHSDTFLSWRDAPKSSSLLVTAPPGSGKSVLSNFVLQHLNAKSSQDTKVIYYFCSIRGDEVAPSARSVLRSLILQLCEAQTTLFRLLPSDWAADKDKFQSAVFSKLLQVFEKLLFSGKHRQIYCVIDGLDVYEDPNMIELVDKLRQMWVSGAASRLRCDQKDITTFIEKRVLRLASAFTEETKESIKSQLLLRSEQSFLWLDVVVRRLANLELPTPIEVAHEIDQSSQDLYELYEELINQATRKTSKAARMLAMVAYSKQPLGCQELQHAMAVDGIAIPDQATYKELVRNMPLLDSRTITQVLGTLLDVVEGKVFVLHQSLKDFLQQNEEVLSMPLKISPKVFPAYTLMKYLCLDHEDRLLDKDYPLFHYADLNWHVHLDSENDVYDHEPLQELLKCLLSPSPGTSYSTKKRDLFSKIPSFLDIPRRADSIATRADIGWLAKIILDGQLEGLTGRFEVDDILTSMWSYRTCVAEVILAHGGRKQFPVSQRTAEVMCRHFAYVPHVMKLLDQRRDEIEITWQMISSAATRMQAKDAGAMILPLLEGREPKFEITPKVLITVAAYTPRNTLETVFKLSNGRVRITSQLIRDLMGLDDGFPVYRDLQVENVKFLWNRSDEKIKVTEDMLAAATRMSSNTELLKFLFDEADEDVHVTHNLIMGAMRNYRAIASFEGPLDRATAGEVRDRPNRV
ncbi:hypothetical protein CkaCkLH20_02522 [Colletotrichum karsti]|uniref:Vegetative incompatibility protein HET-E-1 n=1 Tax=Colletotrichum karsti TaxID=1095194 RepID=A0A9P6IFQ1_9PEZI|nr:uncharacterized protein CkaCkLH20_02522 [Colletotrichum karsti]KAF9879711.1 hypothetical protein CkaCkLH20_02522 [Colletotrichum karsti]